MDRVSTEFMVTRQAKDGWYVYTCDQLPGLYVVNQDDRVAYDAVPRSIANLLMLDYGVTVSVAHKIDYETFFTSLTDSERAQTIIDDRTRELMVAGDRIAFTVQRIDAAAKHDH